MAYSYDRKCILTPSIMEDNRLCCANCGKGKKGSASSMKSCSRCQAVAYCSRDCQAEHWDLPVIGHQFHCVPYEERLQLIEKAYQDRLRNIEKVTRQVRATKQVSTVANSSSLSSSSPSSSSSSSFSSSSSSSFDYSNKYDIATRRVRMNRDMRRSDENTKFNCAICLGTIPSSEDFNCTLPCSHSFHPACLSELRMMASSSSGASPPKQVCPLCRADLPPGGQQAFLEACNILYDLDLDYLCIETCNSDELKSIEKCIKLLQYSARDGGGPNAMALLGTCYSFQNKYSEAFVWYEKASEFGHVQSIFNVACAYSRGEGVLQNNKKAVDLWILAAENGNDVDSMTNLGYAYSRGEGVICNQVTAVSWWIQAAAKGSREAMYNLGYAYSKEPGSVVQNHRIAMDWYSKAASRGDTDSMYELGMYYKEGVSGHSNATSPSLRSKGGVDVSGGGGDTIVHKDPKKAIEWLLKAANEEHVEAMLQLAHLFDSNPNDTINIKNGCGGNGWILSSATVSPSNSNLKTSVEWLLKAAARGNVAAMYRLGKACQSGRGCPQSDKQATEWWFKAAAAASSADSLPSLLYSNGSQHHRQLLEKNEAVLESMYELGCCYEKGVGVLKNISQAINWFMRASDAGHILAREHLQLVLNK